MPQPKQHTPYEEEEDPSERPAVEDLVGESEYSVGEAHIEERPSSHRMARSPATRGRPEPGPDDLGRHALEEATEAPVERSDEETVPLRGPIE